MKKTIAALVSLFSSITLLAGCGATPTTDTSSNASSPAANTTSSAETTDPASAEPTIPPEVHVRARYTFDSIDNGVVPDDGPNGYDGEFFGTPCVVEGKNGSAIELDGSNAVLVPNGAGEVGSKFTVAAWFKVSSDAPMRPYRIFSVGVWGDGDDVKTGFNFGFDTSYGRGGIVYCVGNANGPAYWNRQTEFPYQSRDGEWHHVAVTYDMDALLAVGYLDGQMLDIMQLPDYADLSIPDSIQKVCIGASNAEEELGEAFVGALDDVVILDDFLSEDAIPLLMDNSLFS